MPADRSSARKSRVESIPVRSIVSVCGALAEARRVHVDRPSRAAPRQRFDALAPHGQEPLQRGAVPYGSFINGNHFAGWMLMALALTLGLTVGIIARASPPAVLRDKSP